MEIHYVLKKTEKYVLFISNVAFKDYKTRNSDFFKRNNMILNKNVVLYCGSKEF